MIKLQFGKEHAQENGATHERDGAIYKVDGMVMCWEDGNWTPVEDPFDFDGWLEEIKPINWALVE